MAEQFGRQLLIISVDFGTTYCAVAHALLHPDQRSTGIRLGQFSTDYLHSIQFQSDTGNSEQVKTQLAWCERKQDFLWGGEVDRAIYEAEISESDRLTLLKLALDETDEKTQGIRGDLGLQLEGLIPQCGKRSILELIGIYLEKLYTYGLAAIREARGKDALHDTAVQCLICVPALWDYEEREKMVEVATKAGSRLGLPRPKLVSEPEAAVMFYMQERFSRQPVDHDSRNVVPWSKESFFVLDVGGGTGDLITYTSREQLLREGAAGMGEICGSALLNRYFKDFLRIYLAEDMWSFCQALGKPNTGVSEEAILDTAVAQFEVRKRAFNGFSGLATKDMAIRIPGIKAIRGKPIYDDRILIPSSKISEIFDRILRDIIRMSRDQIEAANINSGALGLKLKRILFVGGLSGSPHARAALESAFTSRKEPLFDYPIEVVTPHQNSSTLISRGAILASLHHDTIGEYYLRCSFGVALDEPFDKRVHTETYKRSIHGNAKILTDYHDGVKIVEKRIRWLYKAGRQIEVGEQNRTRGWIGAPLHGSVTIKEMLYCSKKETRDSVAVRDPGNEIKEVGSVEFAIPEVRGMGYPATNPLTGEEYQRIDYELLMTFHNPRSIFEMIIPQGGKFPEEETWGGGDVSNETRWGENYVRYRDVVHCAAAVFSTRPTLASVPEGRRKKTVSGKTSKRGLTSPRRSERFKKAKRE